MLVVLACCLGVFGDRQGVQRAIGDVSKIIYYLHVHKCGGTTVCVSAKNAGYVVSADTNCNVQVDQRCCGGDTLKSQQEFALSTRYTMVANEQHMVDVMDKVHYWYITALRDPMARYQSHYLHVKRIGGSKLTFANWMAGQPDNWMVRKFCGRPCLTVPKFALSQQHFTSALKKMLQFDEVLFWGTGKQSFDRLPIQGKANTRSARQKLPPPCCEQMVHWDDALYNAAMAKFRRPRARKRFLLPCGNKCTTY